MTKDIGNNKTKALWPVAPLVATEPQLSHNEIEDKRTAPQSFLSQLPPSSPSPAITMLWIKLPRSISPAQILQDSTDHVFLSPHLLFKDRSYTPSDLWEAFCQHCKVATILFAKMEFAESLSHNSDFMVTQAIPDLFPSPPLELFQQRQFNWYFKRKIFFKDFKDAYLKNHIQPLYNLQTKDFKRKHALNNLYWVLSIYGRNAVNTSFPDSNLSEEALTRADLAIEEKISIFWDEINNDNNRRHGADGLPEDGWMYDYE
ncbi:hypothetical protein SCHPADRAFT_948153 [Schizopora paradoxa]|uniref:Uncharacterized protein n=1 Tax=Schizopora paradoxa TaxID=27342 RepID=A0A0H2R3C9_9AGAM|nr:hypothetical protein SCHPADRAFT_948153 [Schizopora paradoxa]